MVKFWFYSPADKICSWAYSSAILRWHDLVGSTLWSWTLLFCFFAANPKHRNFPIKSPKRIQYRKRLQMGTTTTRRLRVFALLIRAQLIPLLPLQQPKTSRSRGPLRWYPLALDLSKTAQTGRQKTVAFHSAVQDPSPVLVWVWSTVSTARNRIAISVPTVRPTVLMLSPTKTACCGLLNRALLDNLQLLCRVELNWRCIDPTMTYQKPKKDAACVLPPKAAIIFVWQAFRHLP